MKTIRDVIKKAKGKPVDEVDDGDLIVNFPVQLKKRERTYFKVKAAQKGKSIASICRKALEEEFGKPPIK